MKLSGWGRYPVIKTNFTSPDSIREVVSEISKNNSIARGNGRSYGDSAIGKKNTICMKKFNKMKKFDKKTGLLIVESGVLLSDIIEILNPG